MLRQDLERAYQYWRNELLNIRDILHLQTFTNFLQEQIDSILQTINRRKDKLTEETKRQEKCRDDSEKSLEMLNKLIGNGRNHQLLMIILNQQINKQINKQS